MENVREARSEVRAFITLAVFCLVVQGTLANSGNSTRTTTKTPSYEILIPGLSLPEPSRQSPQPTTPSSSVPGAQSRDTRVPPGPDGLSQVNCSLGSGVSATSVLPVGCNASSLAGDAKEKIWTSAVIQRVATLVFCMVCALVGNTAIILLLTCSRYRKRNSRVNIFIIHLAIGDLTVCFCTMTTEILFVAFGQWVLGEALCKILPYLQCITLASTTFILTSMSFDRYLAICKPLKYRATTTRAKRFICVSWALAFVLAVPQLLIFVQTEETRDGRVYLQCKTKGYTALWQRRLYFSFFTVYIMIVPIILISFCYISIVCVVSKASRVIQRESYIPSGSGCGGTAGAATTGGATSNHRGSLSSRNSINSSMASHFNNNNCSTVSPSVPLRRAGPHNRSKSTFPRAKIKTLKMTFTIIATFIICWTPYFVTTLIRVYSNYKVHVPEQVMAFVETITFIQSCVNPLIYGFFNIKVKRGVSECCPCGNAIRMGGAHVARVLRRNNSFHAAQEVRMSITQEPHNHVHRIHRPVIEMKMHSGTPKPRHRVPDGSLLGAGPSFCSGFGGGGSLSGTSNSNPSHSHSQSANSVERIGRGGASSVTVTENKNGVRLRVRFARRGHCRCMSTDGLNNSNVSDASMPYDLLLHTTNHGGAHTVGAQLTMYKHHSMQQLYT
ncbi:achatin receptor 1 [Elysia marginata]|uniref:Achatin receptor 1 n=1 Tax=Elysia marginata TaxID=1093978 RepID=A0AAV4HX09_9GAST|nr:achatin receptor 1 [Elysia marginata]